MPSNNIPFKARLFRVANSVHKWAGLALALQIFFWIGGGLIMSSIPLEKVHGKHLATSKLEETRGVQRHRYSLDKLIAEIPHKVRSVRLTTRMNNPIYVVKGKGQTTIYDGITGVKLPKLKEDDIRQLSTQYYLGEGKLQSSQIIQDPPHEAPKAKGETWQVTFDDLWNTTLYIEPYSGNLLHVRSDIWRLFDFVWMLHIMDYDTRDDFNNPLLISFAAAALIFTLSGVVLLFRTFTPRRRKSSKPAV